MTFSVELRETRTYSANIEAPTREHAEQQMRVLVADGELKPETRETQLEAYAELYCEACGETHMGPECRKPVSSALIAPSWMRKQL